MRGKLSTNSGKLQNLIVELDELKKSTFDDQRFPLWVNKTRIYFSFVFAKESEQYMQFERIINSANHSIGETEIDSRRDRLKVLQDAELLLNSILYDMKEKEQKQSVRSVRDMFLNMGKTKLDYSLLPENTFEVDGKSCCVIFPSDEYSQSIYDTVIKPLADEMGLELKREKEIFDSIARIREVWMHISKAGIIIADLSGRNPNVFYEVGMCHAARKKVLLITRDINDVPTELRHLRCIVYNSGITCAARLKEDLKEPLRAIIKE